MSHSVTGGTDTRAALLRIENLHKTFGVVRALRGVDLDVQQGEVHALLGHNGSGKSTLIKILSGYHLPDSGAQIQVLGTQLKDMTSQERHSRLRIVHQDLGLTMELSAAENLALRRPRISAFRPLNLRAEGTRADESLARFGADFDAHAPLSTLSPIQRTLVAIAAALQDWTDNTGLLVLDEPTANLPHGESRTLLRLMRRIATSGTGILFVTHRLEEVSAVSDRVTVLRNGERVATRAASGLKTDELISLMLGSETLNVPAESVRLSDSEPVLTISEAAGRRLRGVNLSVRQGEVLGLVGLPDAGHEELVYGLAGGLPYRLGGTAAFGGEAPAPIDRAASGRMRFISGIRSETVIPALSIGENLSLSALDSVSRFGVLKARSEKALVDGWLKELEIKTDGSASPITSLSGGNQQKVLVARALAASPELLVLNDPTAGVDVAARHAIYTLLREVAGRGLPVVVASTDYGDLLALCHRVLVFGHGRPRIELSGDELSEHRLLAAIEQASSQFEVAA